MRSLRPGLRTLRVVTLGGYRYPEFAVFEKFAKTLEVLWLEVAGPGSDRLPLSITDSHDGTLSWEGITQFGRLKEVAVVVEPGTIHRMVEHPSLKVLQFINYQEKHQMLASMLISNMFCRSPSLPLRLLVFGEFTNGAFDEKRYKIYEVQIPEYDSDDAMEAEESGEELGYGRYVGSISSLMYRGRSGYGDKEEPVLEFGAPSWAPLTLEAVRWSYPSVRILEIGKKSVDWWME
ncbi:hypothetical protein ABW19_dt0201089 [Dactylella cylindrospora]|nr:hypothetical protein ABW19_dt0201089 [Dactylella cylindrospora]